MLVACSVSQLRLKGRYYRTIPITAPGYEEEILELDANKTAFVSLHCWNVGCPENPLDVNYCVDMGFPQTTDEAHRIERDFIRPALDAARRAGIFVCHVQAESIAKKYPQHLEEVEEEIPQPSKPSQPSSKHEPPIPCYREQILFRNHGEDYPTKSPLKDMDFPRVVAPLLGEPVVYTTKQLDYVLRKRGIVNLIYAGFATDMCILNAPGSIGPMFGLGYRVLLIREATLGVEMPDWFEERIATRWAIRFIETHYGDTVGFADFILNCNRLASVHAGRMS